MAGYTYEREVEEFLRWSPHVQRDRPGEKTGVEADSDLFWGSERTFASYLEGESFVRTSSLPF